MAPLVPAAWKSLEHLPKSQLEPFAHGHMGHGVVVINHAQLQLFMALPHPHCDKTLSCGFAQECEIEFLLVPSQMSNMSQPIPARLAHVPHLRGLHVPLLLLSWHWSYKRRVPRIPRSWRRWRPNFQQRFGGWNSSPLQYGVWVKNSWHSPKHDGLMFNTTHRPQSLPKPQICQLHYIIKHVLDTEQYNDAIRV